MMERIRGTVAFYAQSESDGCDERWHQWLRVR